MPHPQLSVILHGGAGNFRQEYTPKKLPFLKQALNQAWDLLCQSAPGHLAVCSALKVMEESQYFNAGFGAFPNQDGKIFLDIGLMSGTRSFISFLDVHNIKYPSQLVLDTFAEGKQLMAVWTDKRAKQIESREPALKERYGYVNSEGEMLAPVVKEILSKTTDLELAEEKHGTVGCVVRDVHGHIYAGTSTGGLGAKVDGRIGDSPIVGSGVFADSQICGLSTSGHGEAILASTISAFVISELRRELSSLSYASALEKHRVQEILEKEMSEFKSKFPDKDCGMILVSKSGETYFNFCSPMFALAKRTGSIDKVREEAVQIARRDLQPLSL